MYLKPLAIKNAATCFLVLGLLLLFRTAIYENLLLVQQISTLLHVNQVDRDSLYNNIIWASGVPNHLNEVQGNLLDRQGLSDGLLTTQIISRSLAADWKGVVALAKRYPELCNSQRACQFLTGKAYYELGQDTEVRAYWRDEEIWHYLIQLHGPTQWTDSEFNQLKRYSHLLLDIHPERAEGYFKLGLLYSAWGYWSDAVPYLERANALDSSNARYTCSLGTALVYTRQDVQSGLSLCRKALSMDSNDVWLYGSAAQIYALVGYCEDAKEIYQQAVSRFPDRTEPSEWLTAFTKEPGKQCTVPR